MKTFLKYTKMKSGSLNKKLHKKLAPVTEKRIPIWLAIVVFVLALGLARGIGVSL